MRRPNGTVTYFHQARSWSLIRAEYGNRLFSILRDYRDGASLRTAIARCARFVRKVDRIERRYGL
jgi:hypothetical protein